MSDVEEEVVNNEAPVASEAAEEEEPAASEVAEEEAPVEEPVEEEAEEAEAPEEEAVASEAVEAPVEEEAEEAAEEAPVEEEAEEEEEPAASEAAEAPVASEAVEAPVASEASEEAPVDSEAVEEPEPVPVEQVASDIREILAPVESANEVEVSSSSSGLSDDLKQRIAELDFLRECCGNWVESGRGTGRRNFLTDWDNKNVSIDSNGDYEDTLNQLEKLPELVKLWAVERKIKYDSNYFKNIQSYTLSKSLYNEKSLTEKVEVVEQLVGLLTKCANGKISVTKIKEFIDNLY